MTHFYYDPGIAPGEAGGGTVKNPYSHPPKSADPPSPPASDFTLQTSENGRPIPIAFGIVRVAGNLIERSAYTFAATGAAARVASTSYNLGDIRSNFGNLYVSITSPSGTTGTGDGPSGTGSGQVDGGVTWDYVKMGYRHFAAFAFCEGQIVGAGKAWQDKNVFAAYASIPHDSSWLTLNLGTPTGGRVAPAWFPIGTDVYGNTAVLWAALATGSDADLPNTSLEIQAAATDVNPADIAVTLLTDSRKGAQWPAGRVDAVSTGTGNAASWKNYCTATGFVMSWLIDTQTSALALIKQLLAATNTSAVWTNRLDGLGGMLKFVPLGTDAITANGATFTPNLTPAYSIGADDLLDTIQVDLVPSTETFNSFPIEYLDRATDYKRITVDDPDMSDVDLRGLVRSPTTAIPMVMSPAAAVQLSRINAQRSLNIRNNYQFQLPYRFLLVEPTDLLTLTDSVVGYTVTVRVTAFEEDQGGDGLIKIEASDFPSSVGAAASYTPQTNDGFKPTVATALGALSVLPGQAPISVVPDSTSTRGAAVDNLWPNHNSETNPPDGVDTTKSEWAGRLNAGTGNAYNGQWVRQLTAAQNGKQDLGAPATVNGGSWGNEGTAQSQLSVEIPCSPGETFYMEAQAKWITVTGAQGCGVLIYFLNASRQIIGVSFANTGNTGGTGAGWVYCQTYGVAPAGATSVRLFCLMDSTLGAATAQFDAIYARRSIDGAVVSKLGGYFVDEIQYASLTTLGRKTSGTWPNIVVDRAWYRGNDDPNTKGGAPSISVLRIRPQTWDTTLKCTRFDMRFTPTAPSDNVDGMRFVALTMYRQSVAGTTGTLTAVGSTLYVPIPDRLYNVLTADNDLNNNTNVTFAFADAGISAGVGPAFIATMYNAHGPSDSHCFYCGAGWTLGTDLTDNGNGFPAGLTGGGGGGTGGGGGAGGGCLDPETPVLAGPGQLVPLRTVRAGDLLWTRPEDGGEMGYHAVESVTHTRNARCRVSFEDGRDFVCSVNHLLNVRGIWRRADSLNVGEEVQGTPGGHVRSVEYLGEGPVVQLQIPTARTYFAGDGCWHHNTYKP